MRTESKKTVAKRLASWSIVGLVVVGALLISGVVDIAPGSSMMTKAFFFFLGAVIMVQVVPCLLLLGAMLKAVASLFGKKSKVHEPTK